MSSNTNTDIWLAGAFAAFTVDLLVYPLDTLKTRIQSPDYKTLYKNSNGSANRSLFRGLYQGVGSIILITIPSSGAFFTTYEALKYTINEKIPPNSTLYIPQAAVHSVSSAGAELVSCAILTPAEVIKQNAQMIKRDGSGKRKSPSIEVFKTFRRQPQNLWRGYTALAARNLPFTGLQFPVFEHLKGYFLEQRKRKTNGSPVNGIFERASITAMSAAIAGSGAAWITTPIDVVKTRIMLAAAEKSGEVETKDPKSTWLQRGAKGNRKGAWAVGKDVMLNEGIRGLFRGGALRAAWTAMGSGLYLGCYEGGRFYLEDSRNSSQAKEGEHIMKRDWNDVKVGVGKSRSQGVIKKSAWQDD